MTGAKNRVVEQTRTDTSAANSNAAREEPIDGLDLERFVMLIAYGVCGGLLEALEIGSRTEAPSPPIEQQQARAEVLTADEVAAMLRLDRKTVYDYAGRGEIPCRRIGKRVLFSREALALWLASCSKRSSEGNSR